MCYRDTRRGLERTEGIGEAGEEMDCGKGMLGRGGDGFCT